MIITTYENELQSFLFCTLMAFVLCSYIIKAQDRISAVLFCKGLTIQMTPLSCNKNSQTTKAVCEFGCSVTLLAKADNFDTMKLFANNRKRRCRNRERKYKSLARVHHFH